MKKLVYGVGVYEKGKYRSVIEGIKTKEYEVWSKMLQRCYDPKYWEKYPTYIDVEVSEEFLNFQEFCEIVTKLPFYGEQGYHMDKDILGLELYSKDTICFIPMAINQFFANNRKNKGECPTGVSFRKNMKDYSARISKNGKRIYLGYFNNPNEAFEVYCKARNEYAKELASIYRGKVDNRVIEALTNYDEELFL